ncbi:MAG: hypothetical protein J7K73_00985 [Nanoarchaeota archaeon]|nr:hypothetical protein [Nanoarchaeota archaeon]
MKSRLRAIYSRYPLFLAGMIIISVVSIALTYGLFYGGFFCADKYHCPARDFIYCDKHLNNFKGILTSTFIHKNAIHLNNSMVLFGMFAFLSIVYIPLIAEFLVPNGRNDFYLLYGYIMSFACVMPLKPIGRLIGHFWLNYPCEIVCGFSSVALATFGYLIAFGVVFLVNILNIQKKELKWFLYAVIFLISSYVAFNVYPIDRVAHFFSFVFGLLNGALIIYTITPVGVHVADYRMHATHA